MRNAMTDPPRNDGAPRDITELIMDDHVWFRQEFAALDDLRAGQADEAELAAAWAPLAARLDLHAVAEEEIFYPKLLRVGEEDPQDETLDAIGDHNDIRDAVHQAADHRAGTDQWWAAVRAARVANDEHMAEEERDAIADFKLQAPAALGLELGRRFAQYLDDHRTTGGVDTSDKDPEAYVRGAEEDEGVRSPDAGSSGSSLGIGSLKGR